MNPSQNFKPQVIQPDFSPNNKPNRKWTVGKILVVIACIIGAIVLVVISFAVYALVSMAQYCDDRELKMQQSAAELRRTLQAVHIDGTTVTSIEARPNGDCLTGHGATAITKMATSGTIQETHTRTMQGLGVDSVNPKLLPFSKNTNAVLDGAKTTIAKADKKYEITYLMPEPLDCQEILRQYCTYTEVDTLLFGLPARQASAIEIRLDSEIQ